MTPRDAERLPPFLRDAVHTPIDTSAAHGDVPDIAFGHGQHFCLGESLVWAELQEAPAALEAPG